MKKQKYNRNFTGFTLIELLVTIVIVGVLSTVSIATFSGYAEKARVAKGQANFAQIKKLFLAQNASTEEELFTGWYSFDLDNSVNASNPYIIDRSEAGNNLVSATGTGTFSQNSDTAIETGKSLRINRKMLYRGGSVKGGPENKLTMAFWFKLNSFDTGHTHTYPVFLTSSTGFNFNNSHKRLMFYMNAGAPTDYVLTPNDYFETNKWYYVVGSYDGDTMRLWIDQKLIATKTGVTLSVPFQGRGLYLGYRSDSGYFDGWLDEVMVFPYAFNNNRLN